MNDTNKGYLGKDGKRYKNYSEWVLANRVVENNEKQTEYLKKQIQMQALQTKQKEIEMQQARRQERERMQHEKELELERQEHDKEMRLLQMFDKVSIPIDIFKKFEKELLNDEEIIVSEEDRQKLINITKSQELSTKYIMSEHEGINEMINSNNEDAIIRRKVRYDDKYKKLENFVNGKEKNLNKEDIDLLNNNKEVIALNDEWEERRKKKHIYLIGMIIFLIIAFFLIFKQLYIIGIIFGIIAIILESLIIAASNPKQLKEVLNDVVNRQMKEDLQEMMKSYSLNIANNEESKQIQDKYNKAIEELIEKRMEYLYDFRIKHYNMQIEKIFYDSGLVNECEEKGVKFKNIDRDQIINEGTFEDYFYFFNNFEQGYKEYEKNIIK